MSGESFPALASYRNTWKAWVKASFRRHGITFDRTPAGEIRAPAGKVRVCAYHIDFDERPTCWLDVDSAAEAEHVCIGLAAACEWNVDYACGYDETGAIVTSPPW